jgi:zona occludens toxin (predicted ATPase)
MGPLGSGKSYHALCDGLAQVYAVKKKYCVANFPITLSKHKKKAKKEAERWIYLDNDEMTVSALIKLSIEKGWRGKESSCLLIIDEAGIRFNARDWNEAPKERKKWLKFFDLSRKLGFDVILIAPNDRAIDRQIRDYAEMECRHLRVGNYGFLKLLELILLTKVFFAVYFPRKIAGMAGHLKLVILRKSIANRYDSMKMIGLDTEQELKEAGLL